jgi:hypothetical protein
MKINVIKAFTWDYVHLAAREFRALAVHPDNSVVFVGTGPVPFTAILFLAFNLCQQSLDPLSFASLLEGCASNNQDSIDRLFCLLEDLPSETLPRCTCIDVSSEAINKASELVQRIGIAHGFTFVEADAFLYERYQDFTVIHLAAMIPEKKQLVTRLVESLANSEAEHRVLVRRVSSQDPRRLFYEPLDRGTVEAVVRQSSSFCSISEFNPDKDSTIMTGYILLSDFECSAGSQYA